MAHLEIGSGEAAATGRLDVMPNREIGHLAGLVDREVVPDGARQDHAGRAGRVTAGTNLVDRQGSSSQRRREVIRIGFRHRGAGGGDRNRTVGSTKDGGDRVAAGGKERDPAVPFLGNR